jgi:hypothetical protein
MANQRIDLKRIGGDTPLWVLLDQAVRWETLRSEYWTAAGRLGEAMDAAANAQRHREALDAMPQVGHRYNAPQVRGRFS